MGWIQLRSRRSPAFWAPIAGISLAAVPLVVWLHLWTSDFVRELEALAATDREAAVAAAEHALRCLGWIVSAGCVITAAVLVRYFQLGLREERLPPSGLWSLGAYRAVTGRSARRIGRLGIGLSVLLAAAGVGFLLAVRHFLEVFLSRGLVA